MSRLFIAKPVHPANAAPEKRLYKDVESIGRMPVGSHALAICLVVFGGCLAIMVNEPYEHLDKDNVGLAEAPLLEGCMDLGKKAIKEDVGESDVHCDDISPCLLVECVFRVDGGTFVLIRTFGEIGDFWDQPREWGKCCWISLHGEERVDIFLVQHRRGGSLWLKQVIGAFGRSNTDGREG
jgi:hypothetical protein